MTTKRKSGRTEEAQDSTKSTFNFEDSDDLDKTKTVAGESDLEEGNECELRDIDKTVQDDLNPKLDKKPTSVNLEGVPIDRGWAWMILLGLTFFKD